MFHAHCVCVVGKNYRLQDIQLSKISAFAFRLRRDRLSNSSIHPSTYQAYLAEARVVRGGSSWRKLVENTGLEPVTSWLQTRRSPS